MKLLDILSKLTTQQIKRIKQNNYYDFQNKLIKEYDLLVYLEKHIPNYENVDLSHDILHNLFKLPKNTNAQKTSTILRQTASNLTQLIEDFLCIQGFKDDRFAYEKQLLIQYKKLDLPKYSYQQLDKTKSIVDNHRFFDISKYQITSLLREEEYKLHSAYNNRLLNESLQDFLDHFNLFYFSKMLKYVCEMINRQNILQVTYDLTLNIQIIEHQLNIIDIEKHPFIKIYYNIYCSLTREEDFYFDELKEKIFANKDFFTLEELKDMFSYAQNFCIKKINKGDLTYYQEIFDLFKYQLENRILYYNGVLEHYDFKNITSVALRLKQYDWLESFLLSYNIYLRENIRENSILYASAQMFFAKKDFKQSIKKLILIEYTDVYYHLGAKSLLLKNYYELEEYESFMSLHSAFKIYLKRNKEISEYQKITYENFLMIIKRILKAKWGDSNELKKIKEYVNNTKQIHDYQWIVSKVEELDE